MKPKFRIGDRVKSSDGIDYWIVLGTDSTIPPARVYVGVDSPHGFIAPHTPWYSEDDLELVGCGIPAPALRWDKSGENFTAWVFGTFFEVSPFGDIYHFLVNRGIQNGTCDTAEEAKEACQAYWQQLWDKEMLLSRENL